MKQFLIGVDVMKFDLVHDIQKVYRKTLNCMSRPGTIENISVESSNIDINIPFYTSTMALMYMLLDTEVNFKIISSKEEEVSGFVNQITYSKIAENNTADFIFILSDAAPENIERAFKEAKIGDLVDPHKSATIVFEVDSLSNYEDIILRGPGIKDTSYVKIEGPSSWLKEREKKNIEYPLGIDIIFTDKNSNIMCLPRTTQAIKKEVC